jgi:hypothetical protein
MTSCYHSIPTEIAAIQEHFKQQQEGLVKGKEENYKPQCSKD